MFESRTLFQAFSRRVLVVLLAAVLSACSRAPTAPLRIGINSWPGYEFIYLAQEKGFYRDAGVDVRVIEFNSLSDARRAYERGQLDALGTSVIEVLQIRDQSGRSPQIVQIVDYSNGGDFILTQPEFDTARLRGARIGVELASLGVYVLAAGLAKHGLTLADVKLESMDQLSMGTAFRNREIDAAVTYPPTSVKLQRDFKAKTLFTTAEIPGEVVDVIAVEESVAKHRANEVAKLLYAFHRAVRYTAESPADAYRIMAKREGISPEEFAQALTDGIKLVAAGEQAEFMRTNGKLHAVIDKSDQILRATKQITGPDRRVGVVNASFADAGLKQP